MRRKQSRARSTPDLPPEPTTPTPQGDALQLRVLAEPDAVSSFDQWLGSLKDHIASTRVQYRLARLAQGNFGDHRERIAGAVSELRIDYGPGYRVYYVKYGPIVVFLLGGGIKAGQQQDIDRAAALWENSKDDLERLAREFRFPNV